MSNGEISVSALQTPQLRTSQAINIILKKLGRVEATTKNIELLLRGGQEVEFSCSLNDLLSLSGTDLKTLLALSQMPGMKAEASELSKLLGMERAVVSSHLCSLSRAKYVTKHRKDRTVIFKSNVVIKFGDGKRAEEKI